MPVWSAGSLASHQEVCTLHVLLTQRLIYQISTDALSSRTLIGLYTPIILDQVSCTGSEERLVDCSNSGIGFYQCSIGEAIVFCSGENCPEVGYLYVQTISPTELLPCNETGSVRLTGSSLDHIGRVEVCYDGHWGTVCDDSATNATAHVVCRQLDHAALGMHYICYMHSHTHSQFDLVHPEH